MTQIQGGAIDTGTARLSTLDRMLPVWIGVAMAAGLLMGRLVPGLGSALSAVEVDGISLPIAIGSPDSAEIEASSRFTCSITSLN